MEWLLVFASRSCEQGVVTLMFLGHCFTKRLLGL